MGRKRKEKELLEIRNVIAEIKKLNRRFGS